jgi:hypothetical protein
VGKRFDSWIVTDEFWQRVELLIPKRVAPPEKTYI